jgi:hypothetical protein
MRNALIFLAFVAIIGPLPIGISSEMRDGFYELSPDGNGALVKIYDHPFRTGNKLKLRILKAKIRSENNANTKFTLIITIPSDQTLPSNVALFVGNTGYPSYQRGFDGNTIGLYFTINGEINAGQIANMFKIKPILRRHPHHGLEISFIPDQAEFTVGQGVSVIFHIRNVGGSTICFIDGGRNRAARDNQYAFVCRLHGRQVEDIGNSGHWGGLAEPRKLRPGESFEKEIDLTKWFAFDKPGTYELIGTYYMEFMDPGGEIPYDRIWTDYATADFSIKIR